MAREVERTAATVDEAVAAALEWLGAEADDVDIEVLREADPTGGEAIVRARLRREGDEVADPSPAPTSGLDELEEQADAVADFVEELLARWTSTRSPSPTRTAATCTSISSTAPRTTWRC